VAGENLMSRPSMYLTKKCDALMDAIAFFKGNRGSRGTATGKEKRFVFLAQIDFWDWEMDELIYSVESFKTRSQAWEASTSNLGGMLIRLGFPVQENELWNAVWHRGCFGRGQEVVAPIKKINEIIEAWNSLLGLCEKSVFKPKKLIEKHIEAYGVQCVKNLDKYRKTPLDEKA
jgi:hypothetical protein